MKCEKDDEQEALIFPYLLYFKATCLEKKMEIKFRK